MNDTKHDQNPHQRPNHNKVNHDASYWTRAHRDWRVWIGVIVMLLAIFLYLASGDRVAQPTLQPTAAPLTHN